LRSSTGERHAQEHTETMAGPGRYGGEGAVRSLRWRGVGDAGARAGVRTHLLKSPLI